MSLYVANLLTHQGHSIQIGTTELDGKMIPLPEDVVIQDYPWRRSAGMEAFYIETRLIRPHPLTGNKVVNIRFCRPGTPIKLQNDEVVEAFYPATLIHSHSDNAESDDTNELLAAGGAIPFSLDDATDSSPGKNAKQPLLRDAFPNPNYHDLALILCRAYDQAAAGKGNERHAQGQPFAAQPMQTIQQLVGTGFAAGQAIKKIQEAQRMEPDAAARDLLGAINYIAGMILHIEMDAGLSGERVQA